MARWPAALVCAAALMGAAGVALAAAGQHGGGGDLPRAAAMFLLLHAGAVLGLVALARPAPPRGSATLLAAASVLALGTALFGGDLAVLGFRGRSPVPLAAPLGGLGMIAGWLLVGVGALLATGDRRAGP